jgi:hypothetical protein
MPDENPVADFTPVSKADIAAFAAKLDGWGAALSGKEQALFHLLLERAKALEPQDVKREQFQEGITSAISAVYTSLVQAWTGAEPGSWVRVDPIWYKAGATPDVGEEIAISATISKRP